MFPTPIHQRPIVNQYIYKIFLPISLIIWLIPIFGILMTSIRGLGDITAGNYWGMPSEFLLFSNIKDVFQNTPMLSYIINSFKITIPTVIGAVAVSCMTGFARTPESIQHLAFGPISTIRAAHARVGRIGLGSH